MLKRLLGYSSGEENPVGDDTVQDSPVTNELSAMESPSLDEVMNFQSDDEEEEEADKGAVAQAASATPPPLLDMVPDQSALQHQIHRVESEKQKKPAQPEQLRVPSGALDHLEGLVRQVRIYDLNGISLNCGLKIIKGVTSIEILSVGNGAVLVSVPNDGYSSGEHLAAVTLARILMSKGIEPFQVDLNMEDRISTINKSKVFGDDAPSFDVYMHRLYAGKTEPEPVEVDLAEHRNVTTGRWDVVAVKNLAVGLKLGEETATYVFDVEEIDIPYLKELEGTVYFQAPKLYKHNEWKRIFPFVLEAKRADFPVTCKVNDLPRLAIRETSSSPVHPMVPGPESVEHVQALMATMLSALDKELWKVPTKMGRPAPPRTVLTTPDSAGVAIPTSYQAKGKRELLASLSPANRPKRGDYELLQEAISQGQDQGRVTIRNAGIDEKKPEDRARVFGKLLSGNNAIPQSYRGQIYAANEQVADPVERFLSYTAAFSSIGSLQDQSRLAPQPVKVAIWQMVRSFTQAKLDPSVTLDYQWALEE